MSLTVEKVVKSYEAINKLTESDKARKHEIPFSERLALADILRKCRGVYEDYHVQHQNLVRKLGAQTANGEITVKPENMGEFLVECQGMLQRQTDVTFVGVKSEAFKNSQVEIDLLVELRELNIVV